MKRDTEHKISVEDLLRLKRAERPPADFWVKFEADIRAKQLSAIVSRRPWWDGISRGLRVVGRHQLPFGAAAALALAWVGVQYSGSRSAAVRAPGGSAVAPVAASPVPSHPLPVVERAALPQEEIELGAQESAPIQRPVAAAASSSHMTQAPSIFPVSSVTNSPFVDGIAVSLADYREATPDLATRSIFGADREFEPSFAASRQAPAEPLSRMDPAEERRARILAPALPAYGSASPLSLASDWMKERAYSEERMYESMDRGSSDRVLVGFRF